MVVSFLATSACSAVIMGNVLSEVTMQSNSIPGFPFCIPFDVPGYLYAFWIPILAFESLLCGMALFRGFQAFHYRQSVFQSGRHLVTLLLRDSIVYFLIIFITYLSNLLLWSTGQVSCSSINHFWHVLLTPLVDWTHWNPCRLHGGNVLCNGQSAYPQRPAYEAWNGTEHPTQREEYFSSSLDHQYYGQDSKHGCFYQRADDATFARLAIRVWVCRDAGYGGVPYTAEAYCNDMNTDRLGLPVVLIVGWTN